MKLQRTKTHTLLSKSGDLVNSLKAASCQRWELTNAKSIFLLLFPALSLMFSFFLFCLDLRCPVLSKATCSKASLFTLTFHPIAWSEVGELADPSYFKEPISASLRKGLVGHVSHPFIGSACFDECWTVTSVPMVHVAHRRAQVYYTHTHARTLEGESVT